MCVRVRVCVCVRVCVRASACARVLQAWVHVRYARACARASVWALSTGLLWAPGCSGLGAQEREREREREKEGTDRASGLGGPRTPPSSRCSASPWRPRPTTTTTAACACVISCMHACMHAASTRSYRRGCGALATKEM